MEGWSRGCRGDGEERERSGRQSAQDLMIKGVCEANGPITSDDQVVTRATEGMAMLILLRPCMAEMEKTKNKRCAPKLITSGLCTLLRASEKSFFCREENRDPERSSNLA